MKTNEAVLREALDNVKEGDDIIKSLMQSIQGHGNYSAEATVTFLGQARQCFRDALAAPATVAKDVGEVDINSGVDARFPKPNSPHSSVNMSNASDRAACQLGWLDARAATPKPEASAVSNDPSRARFGIADPVRKPEASAERPAGQRQRAIAEIEYAADNPGTTGSNELAFSMYEMRSMVGVYRAVKRRLTLAENKLAAPISEDTGKGAVDIGSLQEQSEAWIAVVDALNEVSHGWQHGEGTGIEMAVEAIRNLARPAPATGSIGEDAEFERLMRVWDKDDCPTGSVWPMATTAPDTSAREAEAGANTNCPTCGTHEVELQRVCHNSDCADYAKEISIYQGWNKPASAPPADSSSAAPSDVGQVMEAAWAKFMDTEAFVGCSDKFIFGGGYRAALAAHSPTGESLSARDASRALYTPESWEVREHVLEEAANAICTLARRYSADYSTAVTDAVDAIRALKTVPGEPT